MSGMKTAECPTCRKTTVWLYFIATGHRGRWQCTSCKHWCDADYKFIGAIERPTVNAIAGG